MDLKAPDESREREAPEHLQGCEDLSKALDPELIVVGHLSKPHGTKGELYVWPLTDRPETTFYPGASLLLSLPGSELPDETLPPAEIYAVRPYRRGYLLFLEGIRDRNASELLRDRYLLRPFADTEPLDEGEIFYHQLLGMTIVTSGGEEIGKVREVYGLRPAELLDVQRPDGNSLLIPFIREFVVGWDTEERRMVIEPPEGLLEL
jgi:16S rRNA processing protein RimM